MKPPRQAARRLPPLLTAGYGVGSANAPPKMSELPKLSDGQSCSGAGLVSAVLPGSSEMRQASTAGQSAALRASFQTAAP